LPLEASFAVYWPKDRGASYPRSLVARDRAAERNPLSLWLEQLRIGTQNFSYDRLGIRRLSMERVARAVTSESG